MHIIIATPIYPPEIGGPATYTRELAERLGDDHDVTIVAFADEPEHVVNTRLVVVSKKIFILQRLVLYTYILFREAKHADVIYVQNAVAAGLPAAIVGLLRRKPVVLKFVGDEAWERATQAGKTTRNLDAFLATPEGGLTTALFIAIQKFVLNQVSAVVPPSAFLAEIISRYYGVPKKKIIVNFNAFEEDVDAPAPVRKPHQILSVSRLVSWKRVDGIINALKLVKNSYPDATLVVAGAGPEETKLKKDASDAGCADSVEFKGSLSHDEIVRLEKESGVMVLNSTYEGLPHIALESFAARTPIVATDIAGTREAVLHEKSGLLVPAGDDATLAVAIGRVFAEPELREKITAGGAQLLTEKFSWDSHIDALLAVFASLKENGD